MNETMEGKGDYLETGHDVLGYYAEQGYTVEEIAIDQPMPGGRPKRAEVTVELTLTEPVSSVLDRMEHFQGQGTENEGGDDPRE